MATTGDASAGGGEVLDDRGADDWGPDDHARRQRQAWSRTTPDQRMAWLESAIRFAHAVGALPARQE